MHLPPSWLTVALQVRPSSPTWLPSGMPVVVGPPRPKGRVVVANPEARASWHCPGPHGAGTTLEGAFANHCPDSPPVQAEARAGGPPGEDSPMGCLLHGIFRFLSARRTAAPVPVSFQPQAAFSMGRRSSGRPAGHPNGEIAPQAVQDGSIWSGCGCHPWEDRARPLPGRCNPGICGCARRPARAILSDTGGSPTYKTGICRGG